jgi:hypothetical protein
MDKGYYLKSEYVHLWLHLIYKATYTQREFMFNGNIEILQPGQFITSRSKLSIETGIEESKIERILNTFKSEQQIEQVNRNKFRIISILKWNTYQNIEQVNELEMNSQRTASEQPVNTNNKEKKEKKVKKEIIYPTLNEAKAFFKENGYKESSAEKAWKYYSEADWHNRDNKKVLNWKQTFRGVWFKDENKEADQPTVYPKRTLEEMIS